MEATVIRKAKPCKNILLKPAFDQKLGISVAKKKDIGRFIEKNVIPKVHKTFYESMKFKNQKKYYSFILIFYL